MLNCPLPMTLAWGPEQAVFYNAAYAALSGANPESVPGGKVPSLRPPVWGWNAAAIGAAWDGNPLNCTAQPLQFWRDGAPVQLVLDLHYTPLRDEHGVVRGVLCCMQPAATAAAPSSAGPLHILVVEDNPDAQYLVCEMLRALGYTVAAADSGEQALELLDGARFDVLFSDVSLPGMSGVDLARLALRRQARLAVVFASGYGAALTGQLDFSSISLQKPYDIEQLQQTLADIAARLATGTP